MTRVNFHHAGEGRTLESTAGRGMVLVTVLVIITVLALLGASFSYMVGADRAALEGLRQRQQARLAAESGLARAILLLRDQRTDMDNWYDNEEAFRRILVWAPGQVGGSESLADQEVEEGRPAWRFSLLAYERDAEDERTEIRYGLIDEGGKLNLNTATREQLLALFGQFEHENVTAEQLADALIDWRDADDDMISDYGAESTYYMTLEPRYRAKNGPLQTVEELLMVKGFTGQVLYGEDYNRNGYLDKNEDDGEEGGFPPDDADGVLDMGLLSFVTVNSYGLNTSLDNKPRTNINVTSFANLEKLPEEITEELSEETITFIAEAQKRGYKFKSVGSLLGLEVFEDGSSNYDTLFEEDAQARETANQVIDEAAAAEEAQEEDFEDLEEELGDLDEEAGDGQDGENGEANEEDAGDDQENADKNGTRMKEADDDATGGASGSEESGSEQPKEKGTPVASPVSPEEMAVLMDRLTAETTPTLVGRINVNTAPAEVLRTIPGITEDEVSAMVGKRSQLSGEEKATPAWLASTGALTEDRFAVLCNRMTTQTLQFSIDVVGFADHVGTFRRIQAVVEMQGQLAQYKYYRDVSSLGVGYPLFEDERSEGFDFDDR